MVDCFFFFFFFCPGQVLPGDDTADPSLSGKLVWCDPVGGSKSRAPATPCECDCDAACSSEREREDVVDGSGSFTV